MQTLLSLFDFSGAWAMPYAAAGFDVVTMDLKTGQDARDFSVEWFIESAEMENVDGMLLAPPCTDFSTAGAQYWPAKDRDGRTAASVEIAAQALRAVEFWKPDFWALENPVGRLAKLLPVLGKPRLIFDPCDYAGHLNLSAEDLARLDHLRARNGEGEWTVEEVEFVKRCNAYTKRTCLWGDFDLPEKRRVEPVKVCKQGSWLQKLGGKSEATKAARSVTPAGFAAAFFQANRWSDLAAVEVKRAVRYVRDLFEPSEQIEPAAAVRIAEREFGEIDRARFLEMLAA